jgi:hypothetical protein
MNAGEFATHTIARTNTHLTFRIAANHNFISHDGIVTFTELMDAQQNMYNVGYDLAVSIARVVLVLSNCYC